MIWSKKYSFFLFFFFFIFLFLFFNSKLSPLYEFNSWTDVNIYFTLGKGIMNDSVLYRDLFDHKGPLIFFIYGCGYLISNTSFLGVFLLEVCFYSIGIYYLYQILKLFSSNILALSLSLLFPVFYLFYSYEGGSAEDFILISELISLYYFIKYFSVDSVNHSYKYMFIHGFMIGFTFFIKLNLIFFWFFPLLLIFGILVSNKLYSSLLRNLGFLLLGFLSIALPIFIYFILNNAFDSLWEAYIDFNLLYNSQIQIGFFERILFSISQLKNRDFIFISFCLFGFLFFFVLNSLSKKFGIVVLFFSFIIQVLVVLSGAQFFVYYLLALVPFVVFGLIAFSLILKKVSFLNKFQFLPLFSFIFFLFVGTYRTNFFGYSIDNLITRDFPATTITKFGSVLAKEDNPSLLCLGFDETLTIFTLNNIIPNVRYFFLPNITLETHSEISDAQIGYILNKEVDFLILDERFRYYDYYIDAVDKNYKIKITNVGYLGYNIHLYEKK